MITAEEAYRKSVGEVVAHLGFIEKKINNAISLGKTHIIIRDEPYARWLYNNEYKNDFNAVRVIEKLKNLGYEIDSHYEVKSIAVDIGLIIKWDKKQNNE